MQSYGPPPTVTGGDREQVQIFIKGRNLKDQDITSKSDPCCKVYYRIDGGQDELIGKTQTIQNNLNPDFQKSFQIDYIFEAKQILRFDFMDVDKDDDDDLIGRAEVTVGEIMGSQSQTLVAILWNKKHDQQRGRIIILADKIANSSKYVSWQWNGIKLANTDGFFGTSDPFLRFFQNGQKGWTLVHETEFIKDTLDPAWRPFDISFGKLCLNDLNRPFQIECWDNSQTGKHNYIGQVETTWMYIMFEQKTQFVLVDKVLGKRSNPGVLKVSNIRQFDQYTFVDYLQGGEQINTILAIDFTGSNGDIRDPKSLHFMNPSQMNQYQNAIYQTMNILLNYDHDKNIPVYGFGGQPFAYPGYNKGQVEHCFPLTGDYIKPEVKGLDGIMGIYSYALPKMTLLGPTLFAPVIEYAMNIANANVKRNIYSVLIIITDGQIHDMDKTIDLVIKSGGLPLSIVIIGVGNENFNNMKVLDGDSGLRSQGATLVRDLVQFVEYQKFAQNPQLLASQVLGELPKQLVAYKLLQKLAPNPPIPHANLN